MQPVALRAFVGRPKGVEPRAVLDCLLAEGVRPDDPTKGVSSGDPPAAALLEAVRICDLGVIIYAPGSSHLLYELGALDALKKPVVIVADSSHELPAALLRYLTVRAPLTGSEELRSTIRRVISEVRRSKLATAKRLRPIARALKSTTSKGHKQAKLRAAIAPEYLRQGSPVEVERAVAELLESAGGVVEAHDYPGDRGADLVLWSATPTDVLPHPLLVEVKAGRLSWDSIREAESRLQEAVDKSGATGGVLVYLDRDGKRFEGEPVARSVRRVSFDDLVSALATSSLNTTVRRLLSGQAESVDG